MPNHSNIVKEFDSQLSGLWTKLSIDYKPGNIDLKFYFKQPNNYLELHNKTWRARKWFSIIKQTRIMSRSLIGTAVLQATYVSQIQCVHKI